jgi:hypothetical protein
MVDERADDLVLVELDPVHGAAVALPASIFRLPTHGRFLPPLGFDALFSFPLSPGGEKRWGWWGSVGVYGLEDIFLSRRGKQKNV